MKRVKHFLLASCFFPPFLGAQEKAKTETTKQKFIRAELEARKEIVNPEVFPEDLRKDWEDMRKAAERRRKR